MNNPDFNSNQTSNPTPANDGKGLSVAALVLGILGIVGSFIPFIGYFTTVFAILGLIFGVIGRKKSAAAYGTASGMATAGLVLGIIGVAFAVISLICTIACVGTIGGLAASLDSLA